MEAGGYIYIMTNKNNSVLYTGVTDDLVRRKAEHAAGQGSVFTSKYNCTKLVYFEYFPDINQAIIREKQLKNWKRDWKIALIEKVNPGWDDLDVVGRPTMP